jgi:shikimate 5-dehydrogenase
MTKQFAVIGNPIEQSRSPELHHAFAAKTGVDLNYKKILAPLDGFESAVKAFFDQNGVGMNVTVPFKEQALRYVTNSLNVPRLPKQSILYGCKTVNYMVIIPMGKV